MGAVNGTCDSKFKELIDLLEANLASGEELGASIAIDLDGDLLVDLWGSWRDKSKTAPWQRDTIVNVWSTTKTVTSLAALVLVSQGELDPFAPLEGRLASPPI
jgi:CubicO group peptidase (beta-lactamase class C family)